MLKKCKGCRQWFHGKPSDEYCEDCLSEMGFPTEEEILDELVDLEEIVG